MKPIITGLFLLLVFSNVFSQDKVNWKNVNVLVYTKNGKGYVHDNIPNAVAGIKKLATQHGFKVMSTDDPSVFTKENLKQYSLLIFPTVAGLPAIWEREDECYFVKEMNPAIQTIMAHDITSLTEGDKEKIVASAGPYTELYPAVWHHKFDGGPVWITALGHDKKDYEDQLFLLHILNGIKFIAAQVKKPDFEKAYAVSKDDAIR